MEITFERLFAAVAAVGRAENGWTRPPWSEELRAAEAIVSEAGAACGLVARHDAAGNLWLTDPAAPDEGLVAAGSHLDTVPQGGAFDGALGVVSALCAVAALRAEQVEGFERLAVTSFADEEGWRFGTPIFGSRMLTGEYGAAVLDRLDARGVRLADVGPSDPASARGGHHRLAAFVEIHIEQGLALAPAGAAVGVASGLAARARYAFTADGEANHAGTTPMEGRRDALVAAARVVLAADAAARAEPGGVATVGQLTVSPGGSNVIPDRATGTLDVRALSLAARNRITARISQDSAGVALEPLATDPGVVFDERVRSALHDAARHAGVAAIDLASYAGHDAGVLGSAGVASGMLFVRSPDGVSHNPSEHASSADCEAAVRVLTETLRSLLRDPPF